MSAETWRPTLPTKESRAETLLKNLLTVRDKKKEIEQLGFTEEPQYFSLKEEAEKLWNEAKELVGL